MLPFIDYASGEKFSEYGPAIYVVCTSEPVLTVEKP